MRVAEEGQNAGVLFEFLVLGELTAIVEGDRAFSGFGQTVENIPQHLAGFQRRFALQGGGDEEPCFPLAGREQVAPLAAELHQIAFPMAEFSALFNRPGPLVNGAPVLDWLPAVLEVAPAPARLGPRQVTVQLLRPDFRAVDKAINRLVTDPVL